MSDSYTSLINLKSLIISHGRAIYDRAQWHPIENFDVIVSRNANNGLYSAHLILYNSGSGNSTSAWRVLQTVKAPDDDCTVRDTMERLLREFREESRLFPNGITWV